MIRGIVIYGSITSALLVILILGSLKFNSRLWIQDLPKDLQALIPPKTPQEKKQSVYFAIMFFIIFLLGPIAGILDLLGVAGMKPGFWQSVILSYGIYSVFNLVDLLVIDWLFICILTPQFIMIPGITAGQLRDYKKYFRDFLKGIFVIIIPSLVTATAGYVLVNYFLGLPLVK
jgi:hypothetical protein